MLVLKGATGRVESLTFSPAGGSLAVPRSGQVQVWEIAAPAAPASIPEYGIHRVEFLPGGRKLILVGRTVTVHDRDRNASTPISSDSSDWWRPFDLSPDGTALLVADANACYLLRLDDPKETAWAVRSDASAYWSSLFFLSPTRFVRIASAWAEGRSGTVYAVHDAVTGEAVSSSRVAGDDYLYPVISADRRLIAARRGTRVAVFPCDDFSTKVALFRNDGRQEFTGLAFHPSGRYLAATSNDNTVKLYDTSTWQMAHAFDWQIGRLRSIAFSPDGTVAAAGGDKGKIVVWDFDL